MNIKNNSSNKELPEVFCGDRIPAIYGEYMLAGPADPKSMWNSYTLQEILEDSENCLLVFDGEYLTRVE